MRLRLFWFVLGAVIMAGTMYWWQDQPLFVNGEVAMHEDCCCAEPDAPCTCPEGLDADYVVSWTGGDSVTNTCDDPCTTVPLADPPVTVSETATDCEWDVFEEVTNGETYQISVKVWLDTTSSPDCVWRIEMLGNCVGDPSCEGMVNVVYTGQKATGNDPTGNYQKTGGTSDIDDVAVTEST